MASNSLTLRQFARTSSPFRPHRTSNSVWAKIRNTGDEYLEKLKPKEKKKGFREMVGRFKQQAAPAAGPKRGFFQTIARQATVEQESVDLKPKPSAADAPSREKIWTYLKHLATDENKYRKRLHETLRSRSLKSEKAQAAKPDLRLEDGVVEQGRRTLITTEFKLELLPDYKTFTITFYKAQVKKADKKDYHIGLFVERFLKLYSEYAEAKSLYPAFIGTKLVSFLQTNLTAVFLCEKGSAVLSSLPEVKRKFEFFLKIPKSDCWQQHEQPNMKRAYLFKKCKPEQFVEILAHIYLTSNFLDELLAEFTNTRIRLLSRAYNQQMHACQDTVDAATTLYRTNVYRGRAMDRRLSPLPVIVSRLDADLNETTTLQNTGIGRLAAEFEKDFGDLDFVCGHRLDRGRKEWAAFSGLAAQTAWIDHA